MKAKKQWGRTSSSSSGLGVPSSLDDVDAERGWRGGRVRGGGVAGQRREAVPMLACPWRNPGRAVPWAGLNRKVWGVDPHPPPKKNGPKSLERNVQPSLVCPPHQQGSKNKLSCTQNLLRCTENLLGCTGNSLRCTENLLICVPIVRPYPHTTQQWSRQRGRSAHTVHGLDQELRQGHQALGGVAQLLLQAGDLGRLPLALN